MELNNHSLQTSSYHASLIYFWRQRSLFTTLPHHSRHRKYFSDCILFGFDGTLRVSKADGEIIESPMIMIPANTRFYMEVEGNYLGGLCLDYLGLDFKQAKSYAHQSHQNIYFDFDKNLQQRLLASLAHIHRRGSALKEVEKSIIDVLKFDRTLDHFDVDTLPSEPDPRLSKIINMY